MSKVERGRFLRATCCPRRRFNSSAMIYSAIACTVCVRSSPIRSLICASHSCRNVSAPMHQPFMEAPRPCSRKSACIDCGSTCARG